MIAAVTADALDGIRAAAPPGVEVRRSPTARARRRSWCPRATTTSRRIAGVADASQVVQTLSAGTDWIEPHLPPWATLCAARGAATSRSPSGSSARCSAPLYGQFRAARAADLGLRARRASCTR